MFRRLCFLLCLISFLSLCSNASAQLLARYKFDETSGTIAVDSSIKGNDGIIEKIDENGTGGDPNWVPGWIDGALGFDGNMDVNLPAGNMGLRSDSGTVALWMKMAEITGGINTIWWAGDTSGSGFGPENETHIHIESPVSNIWLGGEFGFYLRGDPNNVHLHSDPNKGDSPGNEPNSPILVDDDQWYHIVGTWGNEDGNAKLYHNGSLLHQIPYDWTNISYPFNRIFLGRMGGGNRPYIGYLDDVQIYGRALTEQEIQNVMAGGAALTLKASLPLPANNGREVPRDAVLSWTEGDTAAKHNVYFGTSFDDVNEASLSDNRNVLLSENLDTLSIDPPGLMDYNQTYYWRVDEVEADNTTIHKGNIWSFTVVNFIVVDNFEDYDDTTKIIYDIWGDYFVNNTGMTVGYFSPPSIEQETIHSGSQSMPLRYDNDGTVNEGTAFETAGTLLYSEAKRQLTPAQNWTVDGVESLSLWFKGNAAQVSSFVENPTGIYTIKASGADIWGTADQFHFAYKEISSGAVTIIAKVNSLENTDPYAKAGIMIRDTLEPGARNVGMFVTPENGTRFQRRVTADGNYETTLFINDANDPNWAPNWVKIERSSGGLVRAYYSETGSDSDWESFSLQVVSMTYPIYVGLAVTSHNAEEVCEAVLSNVTITGTGSDQPWQSQDVGISSNDPAPIYLAVNGNAVIYHDDPNASLIKDWTQWNINLQDFTDQGANLTNVSSFGIGVGTKNATEPSGSGSIFIDDIRLYRPEPGN